MRHNTLLLLIILTTTLTLLSGCLAQFFQSLSLLPNPTSVPPAGTRVSLELVAEGFISPVSLVSPEDDTGRLFIVDQTGVISTLTPDGKVAEKPFLDIRDRMATLASLDERGLLGLAFHPDFKHNGRLFVYYSAPEQVEAPLEIRFSNLVSEFRVGPDNQVDPNSERILLPIIKGSTSHNAGQLAFGPDGYLYIGVGDGGCCADVGIGHSPLGNGQDISTLQGKILRIDVDSGDPYGIPADNPFVNRAGRDEIFAYGFRNPYRFSFDAGGNHNLFVADSGEAMWEEVDIVTLGGNYGWNIKEGPSCFNRENFLMTAASCPDTGPHHEPLIDPIIAYQHFSAGVVGLAITGGYVYRGSALPQLYGHYISGDWIGKLFAAAPPQSESSSWFLAELQTNTLSASRRFVLALGQDADRELYVLTSMQPGPTGNTGQVFKIIPSP
ncbi:MAG: PQQ-dependent sugar dehydrogenase [Deinococcus sp.]|nr:PQQ-dependent sugar dehydrogenase [Deinococcus sp.]